MAEKSSGIKTTTSVSPSASEKVKVYRDYECSTGETPGSGAEDATPAPLTSPSIGFGDSFASRPSEDRSHVHNLAATLVMPKENQTGSTTDGRLDGDWAVSLARKLMSGSIRSWQTF
jgi:hypothetical protein